MIKDLQSLIRYFFSYVNMKIYSKISINEVVVSRGMTWDVINKIELFLPPESIKYCLS